MFPPPPSLNKQTIHDYSDICFKKKIVVKSEEKKSQLIISSYINYYYHVIKCKSIDSLLTPRKKTKTFNKSLRLKSERNEKKMSGFLHIHSNFLNVMINLNSISWKRCLKPCIKTSSWFFFYLVIFLYRLSLSLSLTHTIQKPSCHPNLTNKPTDQPKKLSMCSSFCCA